MLASARKGLCCLFTGLCCAQVRQKRQDRFHEARMKKAKVQQTAQEKAELEKDINLVREMPYTEEHTEQAPKEVSPLLPIAACLPM